MWPLLLRWLWNRRNRQAQQRRWYGARQPTNYWGRPVRRQRGRGGFWGPFPYYSTRTRGGSRVTVTGCCLPLALALVAAPFVLGRGLIRRGLPNRDRA